MKNLKYYYFVNPAHSRRGSVRLDNQPDTVTVYTFILTTFRWHRAVFFSFLGNHLVYYATPANLTYAWSFGSLAGVCLVIQIFSGVFLSMFYTPHVDLAFASVEFIMRDVNHGWLIRYIHSNGASMFFFVVYCHILRGLYYGSYAKPRELLWISGVVLLLLMMATAFLGYVLPWGQMSFWGATVITSMFSVIPKFGQSIVEWLWGGFTVNNPTLNRFFAFHFFLPFVIVGMVLLHLILLHKDGSSAPISDSTGVDKISFYPYFFIKDLFAFFCFLLVFSIFVLYYPNLLGDPNNYILADSIHTPRHIVPEWYFLPFYAILRSIPHKAAGIIAMAFSLLVLFLLPFLNTSMVKDSSSRMFFKICYFAALADFLVLGWLGQSPVKDGYIFVGQVATVYYFIFFLLLLPFSGSLETLWIYYRSKGFLKD
jgi:ubiquinol-cytochrome c reductase cytochrome b subunit